MAAITVQCGRLQYFEFQWVAMQFESWRVACLVLPWTLSMRTATSMACSIFSFWFSAFETLKYFFYDLMTAVLLSLYAFRHTLLSVCNTCVTALVYINVFGMGWTNAGQRRQRLMMTGGDDKRKCELWNLIPIYSRRYLRIAVVHSAHGSSSQPSHRWPDWAQPCVWVRRHCRFGIVWNAALQVSCFKLSSFDRTMRHECGQEMRFQRFQLYSWSVPKINWSVY